jgi:hypothetical protein
LGFLTTAREGALVILDAVAIMAFARLVPEIITPDYHARKMRSLPMNYVPTQNARIIRLVTPLLQRFGYIPRRIGNDNSS